MTSRIPKRTIQLEAQLKEREQARFINSLRRVGVVSQTDRLRRREKIRFSSPLLTALSLFGASPGEAPASISSREMLVHEWLLPASKKCMHHSEQGSKQRWRITKQQSCRSQADKKRSPNSAVGKGASAQKGASPN